MKKIEKDDKIYYLFFAKRNDLEKRFRNTEKLFESNGSPIAHLEICENDIFSCFLKVSSLKKGVQSIWIEDFECE